MNFDRLRKAIGERVQLRPPAISLNDRGMPGNETDDVWLIEEVLDNHIRVSLPRTGHFTRLGKDHVHHYTSNPDASSRTGILHGFLILNVQIYLHANDVTITPTTRPGEPVLPQRPESRFLPQPSGALHAPIPEISELPYSAARERLIQSGWQPWRNHWSYSSKTEIEYGNGPYYWDKGFWEISHASPTGLAHCKFHFRDVYGNHLVVVTAGEVVGEVDSEAIVWNWFFDNADGTD